MKRLFLTLILIVCVLVPVFSKDSGTRFSSISGTVEVAPDADAKTDTWKFGKLDSVLNVDDHVKTGEESGAILSFADMSTFVMKEETHIVLNSPPDKDSKIQIVAGKIWANVKKMMKDGSMEIDMSQAVAGIKGTNITCSTRKDGSEDRIQVLRGTAEVLIKETQERVRVSEGEELVVRPGGKTEKAELDIGKVQEEWKEAISKMGDSIQMNEIPETIKQMMEEETAEFGGLNNEFKALTGGTAKPAEDVGEFKKSAERFVGVLMEDGLVLSSMQLKVEREMAAGAVGEAHATLIGYQKMISDAKARMDGFAAEIGKMLKTNFLTSSAGAVSAEIEMVQNKVSESWVLINSLLSEVQGNPAGLSQAWFSEAVDRCNEVLQTLSQAAEEVAKHLEEHPNDQLAVALSKQIGQYQSEIGRLLKDFAVVEIDGSVLTEMQEADDVMSDAIVTLRSQIDSYNSAVVGKADEVKLERSLGILNNFSKARRLYINSQRLYDSMMRSASGQKFRTAEQAELEATYERITNTYQQLGITAEELQSRLAELESQLGSKLQ